VKSDRRHVRSENVVNRCLLENEQEDATSIIFNDPFKGNGLDDLSIPSLRYTGKQTGNVYYDGSDSTWIAVGDRSFRAI
tara:strand:- start:237 stop:473 length:237 start_codon:yes stop_codon:yes gene_type:complete